MELYRVLLVDDEAEIRQGICRTVDWEAMGFDLCGEAANGQDALELAEQLRPDVLLTDIKMPYMDGLELCRQIRKMLPACKLVVFSGFSDFEFARTAMALDVSEYVLKPVTAAELRQVMERIHRQIDHERRMRSDMELLRRRYEESLPALRQLFITQVLDGRCTEEEIRTRAARYELVLPRASCWATALVQISGTEEQSRDEVLRLPVKALLEERFRMEGCQILVSLYDRWVAVLANFPSEKDVYPLLGELDRLISLCSSYLDLTVTVGVGLVCRNPAQLYRSTDSARAALSYRALVGEGRTIYIGDMEPDRTIPLTLGEDDQHRLMAAIKLGSREQVVKEVHGLMERIGKHRMSLSQCKLYFLELITCLLKLARDSKVDLETAFGAGFDGSVDIGDFGSLEEAEKWWIQRCLGLWRVLSKQRTDSAWRIVERARSYVQSHYADYELGVEVVSSHLHLSNAYFSTLFKRETGVSFTQYVTEIRMDRAARLLLESDDKTYQIAEQTGYLDPNYFSYVFKKHFGCTPSRYRAGGKLL
ncbi:MAG: response regulator transcription factor [Oscillospiraceae bacterium]|nr:response regulator transcription factor [Oscillospiraceae bacterium]